MTNTLRSQTPTPDSTRTPPPHPLREPFRPLLPRVLHADRNVVLSRYDCHQNLAVDCDDVRGRRYVLDHAIKSVLLGGALIAENLLFDERRKLDYSAHHVILMASCLIGFRYSSCASIASCMAFLTDLLMSARACITRNGSFWLIALPRILDAIRISPYSISTEYILFSNSLITPSSA